MGGSTIDWVIRTKGVSFRHAVELLRADHPSLAAGDGHVVRKGTAVKLEAPVTLDAGDQQTLRDVVGFYRKTLGEAPEALRYLESRGLAHAEIVDRFQLGFANRTLGLARQDRNRKAGADLRGRLQRLGILRASGHDHFLGSVVFPVISLDGDVTEIYGQDHGGPARRDAAAHVSAGAASRGVERRSAHGLKGDCPVRIDHRRADVLVRGVPQRDGQLRRAWLHGEGAGWGDGVGLYWGEGFVRMQRDVEGEGARCN